MSRPAVVDALRIVKQIDHAEALRVLVLHQDQLCAEHGAGEVARMFARHLWALLEDQR